MKLEEARIEKLGFESTRENMVEHSLKYEGLVEKINDLEKEAVEVKENLRNYNSSDSSKRFTEGSHVYITGTFTSNVYAPNQFVFAAQTEHVETGQIEYVEMSTKQNITKKKAHDVELRWTPQSSGEYILKLYVLDGSTMGAVLKNPVINHIYVEPANNSLASMSFTSKNWMN